MSKSIILFPGQGSHFVGMGRDLIRKEIPLFATLLEVASDYTSRDLKKILLEGPNETFIKAANLQPIISAVSLGYWSILRDGGIDASIVAGHSLGEITALGATGVLTPELAVEASAFRGELMDRCAPKDSGMSAVLMASVADCQKIIDSLSLNSTLFVANDNAPNQVVISGLLDSIGKFSSEITEKMRCKVQPISVSGPWHTPYIKDGSEEFSKWVGNITYNVPNSQFLMNGTADFESEPEKIKGLTAGQLINPVYWRESMVKLGEFGEGYDLIEIGPGKILTGLLRANKVNKKFSSTKLASSVEECKIILKLL